jgi:hypothetical protein
MVLVGDAATSAAFEALAEAYEAQDEAREALAAVKRWFATLICGPILMMAAFYVAMPEGFIPSEGLPTPTQLMVDLGRVLSTFGLPAAVLGLAAAYWLAGRNAPEAQRIFAAAGLLRVSALQRAGLQDAERELHTRLTSAECMYLDWRQAFAPPGVAMHELAMHALKSGRARARYVQQLSPLVGALIAFGVFTTIIFPLYLPIFRIAGAVK